jgi:hypothetical protein
MEDSLSSGRATKHQQQNGPRKLGLVFTLFSNAGM